MTIAPIPNRHNQRFEGQLGEPSMMAVVTAGNGDLDQLVYRRVPRPQPQPGEVLLRVLAAGVNNTDINTRIGWYGSRSMADAAVSGTAKKPDKGWNGPTPFPLIQGTDCCGHVVAAGSDVCQSLVGARALVRSCMRRDGFASLDTVWLGSDFDGAFAEYVVAPASDVFPVACDWSDAELGSIPCAYGTAENMLHRAQLRHGEHVLVAGASGGVGAAVVQLAKRRGAFVTAMAGAAKQASVLALGADRVLDRNDDPSIVLGTHAIDVVVDNVAGPGFGTLLAALRRGGRYVSSGAIAGAAVALEMQTFYLRDLTLIGCTAWDEPVFGNLISYIERGEIRPLVAMTYPLDAIADAQTAFLKKEHVGKIVLIPNPSS
jgi:NADPH:quinone reductase-like Zn-dependent oxidoreductase